MHRGLGQGAAGASTPQQWITRLRLREAKTGRTVVRLKGGDPCVFGRGGEEQDAASRAGVPVESPAILVVGEVVR